MRHQTAAHFRKSLGRQYRFRAFALIAAPHAADVETRAASIAFDRRIPLFAAQITHANRLFVGRFVERNGRQHRTFVGREFFHVVVEARNRDAAVAVDHLGQQFAEHQCGVGHRTAEVAGVQVAVRSRYFNLPIGQTAQTRGERGEFGGEHRRVAHQNHITAQQFAVRREEGRERGTADFLFAFENELHIVLQQTVAHEIFEGFDLNERLSFVVVRAARPNEAVAHLRFEGIGVPKFERFGRHHVIVRIHQHGGRGRIDQLLGVHQGIAGRGHHLRAVAAGFQEQLAPAFGTAVNVGATFRVSTHARNANERKEFFEKAGFVLGNIVLQCVHEKAVFEQRRAPQVRSHVAVSSLCAASSPLKNKS